MNLFDFREEDAALHISPQFWVYVVATVPLTFVTVGAWYYYKKSQDRKRKKRYDVEQLMLA
jgi:hypothetical protein